MLSLKLDLKWVIHLLLVSARIVDVGYHTWFQLDFWIFNILTPKPYVLLEENFSKKSRLKMQQIGKVIFTKFYDLV